MSIEAQIRAITMGLGSDEVVFLIKGIAQVPTASMHFTDGATKAEAILQMLKDGWTAIPF